MKRYNTIFSAFHSVYRLTTASSNVRNFSVGICRIYKNVFRAERVLMICKNCDSYNFIKTRLENKHQNIKKGGISILTKREKEILNRGKTIILNNRMIYPFFFTDMLGAIYVKRKTKHGIFNDVEHRWFLSLSEAVSVSLRIYNLYREENKTMINYIKSLTQLLNQYVPTSYLHTKGILKLIKAIGKEIKLSEEETKSLEYASLLHDTGKIHLPSSILKKQQPLTDEEFKLIMKHPRKGVELVKNLEILKPALPIILHHHERYDGEGYPSRLKENQIPIGSRILSILDAFDAMYFGRPYKKKKKIDAITKELRNQMGKQFDPKIVEIFLKVLKRKDVQKYLDAC